LAAGLLVSLFLSDDLVSEDVDSEDEDEDDSFFSDDEPPGFDDR
jgi:hypothetical protein